MPSFPNGATSARTATSSSRSCCSSGSSPRARTMAVSAAISILGAFVIGFINFFVTGVKERSEGQTVGNVFVDSLKVALATGYDALIAGARSCVSVAVACAMAGLIAGCITVTGLAGTLINAIVNFAGDATMIGLVLTMLCCIILGMGVPTTANYCIMASTCAPILIQLGDPGRCRALLRLLLRHRGKTSRRLSRWRRTRAAPSLSQIR